MKRYQQLLDGAERFLGPNALVSKKDLRCDYHKLNDRSITKIISSIFAQKKRPNHIAYLSTYSENYTRTESILALLRRNGYEVDTYIFPKNYAKLLLTTYQIRKKYPLFIVGFRGHETLPFIKLIIGKRPLIFDAFVSIYDTLCFDRQIISPRSLFGRILKLYDQFLCRISTKVLVDTKSHRDYFIEEFQVNNVDYLYLGANDHLFKKKRSKKKDGINIFWYGQANPLQGVKNILRWAKSLEQQKNISFTMVGPVRKKYHRFIRRLKLSNVTFIDFIPYEQLADAMNEHHICLGGHFSKIPKAGRVIAGKTYQMINCCDAVLVADNPANKEIFHLR